MKYSRDLLADLDLSNISEVSRTLGITRNTARNWIVKYNQNEPTPPTNIEIMEVLQDVQSMLKQLLSDAPTPTKEDDDHEELLNQCILKAGTKANLSKAIGVGSGTISNWASGKRTIREDMVQKLIKYLW